MNITDLILAVLTDAQFDRILSIIEKIVQGVAALAAVVLPLLVLHFQKRNFKSVTAKQEENAIALEKAKQASETALNVANGHNEKIANLTEVVAKSIK